MAASGRMQYDYKQKNYFDQAAKQRTEDLQINDLVLAHETKTNQLHGSKLDTVLVHSRRRFLRGVPSQFAEYVKFFKYSALHACMCMHWHVRTLC
jgi:hypothetical protein